MREKTSLAKILTARFNPINSQDKIVLDLLDSSGWKFKEFVTNYVLSYAGYKPENFTSQRAENGTGVIMAELEKLSEKMESKLDNMLAQMTQDLIDSLQESGKFVKARHDDDDDKDDSGISSFARNFGRSFLERQQEDE